MVITSLVENTSCRPDVGQEHGLSLFIQSGGHTILFDFGQSELFCENAFALGADLTSVEYGVLSHGHYDHGGGLRRFLQVNSNANVYVSRAAFEKHYNAKNKYIGLDEELCGNSRLIPVDTEMQLTPQIHWKSEVKESPEGNQLVLTGELDPGIDHVTLRPEKA